MSKGFGGRLLLSGGLLAYIHKYGSQRCGVLLNTSSRGSSGSSINPNCPRGCYLGIHLFLTSGHLLATILIIRSFSSPRLLFHNVVPIFGAEEKQ